MADYVEKWGDSVDAAVQLALKDLRLSEDEVEVEVLEQPSRGFFGIHKKLAKVRVTRKPEEIPVPEPEEKVAEEPVRTKPEKPVQEVPTSVESDTEEVPEEETRTSEESTGKPKRNRNERSARNRNDRRKTENGAPLLNTVFTIRSDDKDAVDASDSHAVKFIDEMTESMGLDIKAEGFMKDDTLYINLSGKGVGTMIGKRGQTLDAVQYLASIVQNRNTDSHVRVLVNAERYREKREKTLQQLAGKIAEKCVRSGKNQRLEPMNPYERKVIHSSLQSDPRVTTRSEGVEPWRRVVVELKK